MNQSALKRFPEDIEDFADAFATLRERRRTADYGFRGSACESEAMRDVASAKAVIARFASAPIKDPRTLAAFVSFRTRE